MTDVVQFDRTASYRARFGKKALRFEQLGLLDHDASQIEEQVGAAGHGEYLLCLSSVAVRLTRFGDRSRGFPAKGSTFRDLSASNNHSRLRDADQRLIDCLYAA